MVRTLSVAVLALAVTGLVAAADLKSGPQAGQDVPGPFHPLNVTGENANEKHCLFCEFGEAPVAMIFAREASPAVVKLAQKIDAAAGKAKELCSAVIFCSDDAALPKQAAEAAKQAGLKKVVFAIDNPAGPDGYKVAKDADVTVVLYLDRKVASNFAFKKGELGDKQVEQVVADLAKILPK